MRTITLTIKVQDEESLHKLFAMDGQDFRLSIQQKMGLKVEKATMSETMWEISSEESRK